MDVGTNASHIMRKHREAQIGEDVKAGFAELHAKIDKLTALVEALKPEVKEKK